MQIDGLSLINVNISEFPEACKRNILVGVPHPFIKSVLSVITHDPLKAGKYGDPAPGQLP
ncbi:MAG: hypothetical protein IPJ13_01780 [Saprospiraceae bacterium]|nr:hypothetical protein [Saprospiraceae bacterium]